MTLQEWLTQVGAAVEASLLEVLPPLNGDAADPVRACMHYACLNGGKRLRPALVLASFAAVRGASDTLPRGPLLAGVAMEMLHVYSLVQDDLPCMDNDDLRRGKPTAHKAFNETVALLASDGLQTGAFGVLAHAEVHADPAVRLAVIEAFVASAGVQGMVAGQMLDMAWEWQPPVGLDAAALAEMNMWKTGLNIQACCVAGGLLAGADAAQLQALRTYGAALGRAYQIYDDVLDVIGTAESLGKTAGKDAAAGKTTWVSLLGLAGARQAALQAAAAADTALAGLAEPTRLREIAQLAVTRQK